MHYWMCSILNVCLVSEAWFLSELGQKGLRDSYCILIRRSMLPRLHVYETRRRVRRVRPNMDTEYWEQSKTMGEKGRGGETWQELKKKNLLWRHTHTHKCHNRLRRPHIDMHLLNWNNKKREIFPVQANISAIIDRKWKFITQIKRAEIVV